MLSVLLTILLYNSTAQLLRSSGGSLVKITSHKLLPKYHRIRKVSRLKNSEEFIMFHLCITEIISEALNDRRIILVMICRGSLAVI